MKVKQEIGRFLVYGFGSISGSALNLLLIPLYLSSYDSGEYGVVNILLMFITFGSMFVSAGMMSALQKQYFDETPEGQRALVSTVVGWYGLALLCLGSVTVLLRRPLSVLLFQSTSYGYPVSLLPVVVLLTLTFDVWLNLLRLEKRASAFVLLSLLRLLVDGGLKYALIVALRRGVAGYFEASLVALLMANAVGLVLSRRKIALKFDGHVFRSLLRLSSPYIVTGFAIWSLRSVDRLMLNFLVSESATGVYSVGVRFGQVFNLIYYQPLSALLPAIVFPLIRESNDEAIARVFRRMLNLLVLAGGLLALITTFVSIGAIDFLSTIIEMDSAYLGARNAVPYLVGANLLYSLAIPAGYTALHVKRTELAAVAGLVAAVANLVLNYFLIRVWGVDGAAIATLASFLVYLIAVYGLLNRRLKVRYDYARATVQLAVAGTLLAIGVSLSFGGPILSTAVKCVVGCLLLALLAWRPVRIIDESLKLRVRALLSASGSRAGRNQ